MNVVAATDLLQQQAIQQLSQAYSSVSLARAAELLGCSENEAITRMCHVCPGTPPRLCWAISLVVLTLVSVVP